MPRTKSPLKRRRPLKRTKLGGGTISVQRLKDDRYALVIHGADGKRSKKEYATQGEALIAYTLRCREAERVGLVAAATIEAGDRRAVSDFKNAVAGWQNPPAVAAALQWYLDSHKALATSGTVAEAIDRRKTDAIRRGLSARHKRDLDNRLDRFALDFGERALSSITPQEFETWLHGLNLSAQTLKNYRSRISSIFTDALAAGRIQANPIARVKAPKVVRGEPETITAEELQRLLPALPERSLPVVAIMALAGVRRAEAEKLEWRHIKLADRLITITEKTAKTASRRHVPIVDSLAAWLEPYKVNEGPVAPNPGNLRWDIDKARAAAGITRWPANCLRHTCASAWAATEHDIAKVAGWLGNSPTVVHAHYRALLTKAEAEAWFAVGPSERCPQLWPTT